MVDLIRTGIVCASCGRAFPVLQQLKREPLFECDDCRFIGNVEQPQRQRDRIPA